MNKLRTRAELLEHNPFLKENALTRIFCFAIVPGAALDKENYRALLMVIFGSVFFEALMIIDVFFGITILGLSKKVKIIILLLGGFSILGSIAVAYGYNIRHKIDSTSVLKLDYVRIVPSVWMVSGLLALVRCSS